MVASKIYVEGGGDSKALRTKCREGFRKFLEKAGLHGRMPRIVACGNRRNVYDDFCTALRIAGPDDVIFLLVDSEDALNASHGPWEHLKARVGDNWDQPAGATDENAHLMVHCMEAWFLADKQALSAYYGQNFNASALPANPNVEQIPKGDILNGLKGATRATQKGKYDKGDHSFAILAVINPDRVVNAAPNAKRFIETLNK